MILEKKYNPIKFKVGQIGLKRIIKKTPTRNIRVCSLENIKTAGILFAVNDQNSLEQIRKMLKKMQKREIKTYALGYIPVKKPDDFYLSQKGFNFFSDSDLNFFLMPKSETVQEFINTEFDVLIDIFSEQYLPNSFIINLSRAYFKVGCISENKPFDLMIDVDKQTEPEYYFDQVLYYLEKLK